MELREGGLAHTYKQFLESQECKANTIVCKGNSSGNQWTVTMCGKNVQQMMGFTPGQNLTGGQVDELKSKKWDVRYADKIDPVNKGPKPSGKAGVPQSD